MSKDKKAPRVADLGARVLESPMCGQKTFWELTLESLVTKNSLNGYLNEWI